MRRSKRTDSRVGGPTKSELWEQIQTDVYGRAVSTLKIADAAVLGAVICGGVGIGIFSDIKDGVNRIVEVDKMYEPISENTAIYEELYEVFCDVYEGLSQKAYDKLAKNA